MTAKQQLRRNTAKPDALKRPSALLASTCLLMDSNNRSKMLKRSSMTKLRLVFLTKIVLKKKRMTSDFFPISEFSIIDLAYKLFFQ